MANAAPTPEKVVIVGQGYVGLPLAVALYLGFKWARHTRIVPLDEIDLTEEGMDLAGVRG